MAAGGSSNKGEPMFALGDFSSKEEIFRSSAGAVYKAVYKKGGKTVVLKERRTAETGVNGELLREVDILKRLHHPNIIKCYGYFFGPSGSPLYIVLQYAEKGDLYKLIQERRALKKLFREEVIWSIFKQACAAVSFAHSQGVIHRDLKTHNIFVTGDNVIKVGDFGVGRVRSMDTVLVNTFFGTPLYLSPELCENRPYNEKTDVWALGVILYELACLRTPFLGNNLIELVKSICKCQYPALPKTYTSIMPKCVNMMLQPKFEQRPSAASVLDWLHRKEAERNGARAAKAEEAPAKLAEAVPEPTLSREQMDAEGLPHHHDRVQGSENAAEAQSRGSRPTDQLPPKARPLSAQCDAPSGRPSEVGGLSNRSSVMSRQERLEQRAQEYRERMRSSQGSRISGGTGSDASARISGIQNVYPGSRDTDPSLRASSDTDSAILQRQINEWNLSNGSSVNSFKKTNNSQRRSHSNAVNFGWQ